MAQSYDVPSSRASSGEQPAATGHTYYAHSPLSTGDALLPTVPPPQSLAGPPEGDAIIDPRAPPPQPLAGLPDVEAYIALHHTGSWQMISLNVTGKS